MVNYLLFLLVLVGAVVDAKRSQQNSYGESVARHAMQSWLHAEKAIEQRYPFINRKQQELDRLNKRMALHARQSSKHPVADGIRKLFKLGRFGL